MSEKIYEKLSDKREILARFIAIQAVPAEILMKYFPLLSSFVDCKKIKLDVNFNLTTSPWQFIHIRMMILFHTYKKPHAYVAPKIFLICFTQLTPDFI